MMVLLGFACDGVEAVVSGALIPDAAAKSNDPLKDVGIMKAHAGTAMPVGMSLGYL